MIRIRKLAAVCLALMLCLSLSMPALADAVSFPLAEKLEVTYWAPMRTQVARSASTYDEIELYQGLQEMTNIDFTFIHPTLNEEDTAFNLLLARELPDIIEYDFEGYIGGVRQATEDGIVMDVSELIPQYMPNFSKLLESMPEIKKTFGASDGSFGFFPFIRDPNASLCNGGLIIREDLLAKTGLEKPTTIDELHDVLVALKQKAGVEYPLLISDTTPSRSIFASQGVVLTGAWDIVMQYYSDNGTVKYGPYEPAYKDMMTTLSQWFAEGLIEPEFTAVNSQSILESGLFGGDWAVFTQNIAPMIKMTTEGRKLNPDFTVGGVAPLTLEKGGSNRMLTTMTTLNRPVNFGIAISSACDPEKLPAILSFIDYGYSPEGSLIYSVGNADVCYTENEDGVLVFTDAMINNPAGIGTTDYWYRYCRGNDGGAYLLRTTEYADLCFSEPMQIEATRLWTSQMDAYVSNPWNLKGTLDGDAAAVVAQKQVDIDTYVHEMFVKFLTGKESLDNFDKYIETLETMGIKEILGYYQAAEDLMK